MNKVFRMVEQEIKEEIDKEVIKALERYKIELAVSLLYPPQHPLTLEFVAEILKLSDEELEKVKMRQKETL